MNPRSEFGGVVCAPISGNWTMFVQALKAADQQVGRPRLPGCRYSAVSLGMWITAHIRVEKTHCRKVAESALNSALESVGLGRQIVQALPDSAERGHALDLLEDLVIAVSVADDEQRPIKAADLWDSALEAALEIGQQEGAGCLLRDPRCVG